MGELAVKQESEEAGPNGAHQSGRYTIEPEKLQALQPLAAGASNSAILAVQRLSDEEQAWIEERTGRVPAASTRQLLPSAPAANDAPAPSAAAASDEEPLLSALRPYYREP